MDERYNNNAYAKDLRVSWFCAMLGEIATVVQEGVHVPHENVTQSEI